MHLFQQFDSFFISAFQEEGDTRQEWKPSYSQSSLGTYIKFRLKTPIIGNYFQGYKKGKDGYTKDFFPSKLFFFRKVMWTL